MRDKLTLWQRSIIAVMYLAERDQLQSGPQGGDKYRVSFSRRSFENLLQFDWQGYHTAAITELEEMGWLIVCLLSGEAAGYRLTEAAAVNMWQNRLVAMGGMLALTQEECEIPF